MDGPGEADVMEHGPDPIGRLIPLRPGARAGSVAARSDGSSGSGSPPPELQQDLATAQQVIAQLAAQQVNLHFDVDQSTGKVRIEMIDGNGKLIKEIPARRVLDSLTGGGLLIDEQA
jgi:FlaG protein